MVLEPDVQVGSCLQPHELHHQIDNQVWEVGSACAPSPQAPGENKRPHKITAVVWGGALSTWTEGLIGILPLPLHQAVSHTPPELLQKDH